MKVAFDFDGVLDQQEVQDFAKECIEKGCTVYIVTSRLVDRQKGNEDLYDVASDLDIPHSRVIFTNRKMKKSYFYDNSDFAFHLDDDQSEILFINDKTKVKAIWSVDEDWKEQCLKHI